MLEKTEERRETDMSNKKRNLVLVVIEGLFANLLFGSLFVWTMLRNPLLELFPTWNEGMLSVIFGIHNLFICVGIMLGGLLCRKLPTRKVFCIFLTLAVIGLAGFALLPVAKPTLAYWMAFTLFCIFAAFGVGIGINVTQSTTIPWFPKNSGAISGALYMALGVSSVIMAAIAQRIMPVIGVKYILPVFAGLILIVGVLILCDRKSITAPVKEAATGKELEGIPPKEMLRSAAFWVLVLWNICLRTCGLTLLDHAASMASAFGGLALTAMLIAPANGLGSLSVGVAMDRLGTRKIMFYEAILMIIAAVLLCTGVRSARYILIFIGLVIGGFSYGGSSSSYAASVKNRFGAKFYTQNFAFSNLAVGIAALLESTSGSILDVTGGYLMVMLMVLGLAAIAFILSLFTKKAKL